MYRMDIIIPLKWMNQGNGVTTYASHMSNHAHKVVNGVVMEAEGHSHSITMTGVPIHNMDR